MPVATYAVLSTTSQRREPCGGGAGHEQVVNLQKGILRLSGYELQLRGSEDRIRRKLFRPNVQQSLFTEEKGLESFKKKTLLGGEKEKRLEWLKKKAC